MPETSLLLTSLAVVLTYTTAVWVVSLILRDSGIMDVFWGPGFAIVVVLAAWMDSGFAARANLVQILVGVWAIRLALHIGVRNAGQPEDARYAKWRAEAGAAWWWRSWFKVFFLQGTILWIVSWPLQAAVTSTEPSQLTAFDWLGALVFVIGFLFESIADWQLLRFKKDPANKGKVFDRGLWRYTRHPNYFGESVIWMGVAIWALGLPGAWPTLIGPVLMIWLLLKVSGVAMLDRHMKASKPAYADYINRTSAFIPRPPRE